MKLFSIRMGVFAVLFFVFNLLAKKYLFEDQINEKSILYISLNIIVSLICLYFLNRKTKDLVILLSENFNYEKIANG